VTGQKGDDDDGNVDSLGHEQDGLFRLLLASPSHPGDATIPAVASLGKFGFRVCHSSGAISILRSHPFHGERIVAF
ncbi:hypothetical protein BDR05DRAFT_956232, partial [Suillus weaverae]